MSISTPNAISTPNTSPTITTDALIIGFGKGGKTLAAKLSAAGRKVVVAEASADMYGGTCINIGCLPSKSLILSAEQARRDGANSTPETREAAFEAAIKEKRRVTSMLRDKNYHKLADQDNITVITGRAHFTGPHSVEIATAEGPVAVTASKIFINTGATPRIPDIPGIHTTPGVYTSTGLMDLDDMPQRLVIIGSGFIGLEFASMFADFGTAVTVLQHNAEFLPREDADVAAAIRAQLEAQGVKFLFNADTKANAPAADGGDAVDSGLWHVHHCGVPGAVAVAAELSAQAQASQGPDQELPAAANHGKPAVRLSLGGLVAAFAVPGFRLAVSGQPVRPAPGAQDPAGLPGLDRIQRVAVGPSPPRLARPQSHPLDVCRFLPADAGLLWQQAGS